MLASVATTAHWPVYCLGINLGPAHCLQGAICKHLSIKLLQLPEPFSSGQAIPEWQMLAGTTTVCALVKRTPPTINAMRKCETLSTGFGPRFRWIADPITVKNSWHHSCGAFKFEKVTWPLKSNIHCHKQFHPVSFCSLGSGSELHWSCPQTPWSLAPSISSALQWQNSTLLVGMYDDIGQLGHSHWKWRATIGATSASNFNQAACSATSCPALPLAGFHLPHLSSMVWSSHLNMDGNGCWWQCISFDTWPYSRSVTSLSFLFALVLLLAMVLAALPFEVFLYLLLPKCQPHGKLNWRHLCPSPGQTKQNMFSCMPEATTTHQQSNFK